MDTGHHGKTPFGAGERRGRLGRLEDAGKRKTEEERKIGRFGERKNARRGSAVGVDVLGRWVWGDLIDPHRADEGKRVFVLLLQASEDFGP
jgi:hypothetical protein